MQENNGRIDSDIVKDDEVLCMNSDLQLEIFSYLAVVDRIEISKVCEAWKNLVDAPIFWKSIRFANVGRIMYRFQKDLERMLDMYPGVLELDLSHIPWAMAVDRVSFSRIFNAAVTLRSLRLHGGYWDGKLFISINEEFPNLERLHVTVNSAPSVAQRRVIGGGRALARPCVEIRHCNLLDLNLSGDWASTAIVHCPKLHTLRIRSLSDFNEYDDSRIVCPSITSLSLDGNHSLLDSFGFFGGGRFRETVPLLSSLLDLSLSLVDYVGPLDCLSRLTQLESLSVKGHKLRSCTVDLHSLRIASFDCQSLHGLSLRCPMMVDLRYKKFKKSDVRIPEDMLNLLSDTMGWDHLEVLHLHEYKLPASVVITFSQLKELVLLDVGGHTSMASLTLDCPCLKKLAVRIYHVLEDIDLHLPEAEEIHLGSLRLKNLRVFAPRTQKFTVWDNPIQISAFDCPAVVDLTLNCCFWLEDSDLAYFVLQCPLVHTLIMNHFNRLTSEGLEAALRGWSNLTHLSLLDTRGGSHISNFHVSCPNLKSLELSMTELGHQEELTDAVEDSEVQGWLALLGQSVGALTSLENIVFGGKEFSAEVLIDVLTHCVTSRKMHVFPDDGLLVLDLPELPFQFVSTSQLRSFTLSCSVLSSVTCPKYSSWHQLEVLEFWNCTSLANVCLNCPNLKELDLCGSIVETLVLHYPKLTLLNVNRSKISTELVKEIEEYLPVNFRLRDEWEHAE